MSVKIHLHLHWVDELVPHLVHHQGAHLDLLAVEVSRLDGFGLTAGGVLLRDIVSRGLRLQPPELLELRGDGDEESHNTWIASCPEDCLRSADNASHRRVCRVIATHSKSLMSDRLLYPSSTS